MSFIVHHGSVVGPYHKRNNMENQDSYKFISYDSDTIICAVSDGAGSHKFSKEGSTFAVNTVLEEILNLIPFLGSGYDEEDLLMDAIYKTHEKFLQLDNYEQKGCTLTVAIIHPEEYYFANVGDSSVVFINRQGVFERVSTKKKTDYTNVTELLSNPNDDELEIVTRVERFKEGVHGKNLVCLMTDGMDYSALAKDGSPNLGLWEPISNIISQPAFSVTDFFKFLVNNEKILDDTTVIFVKWV